ncbi:GNAT family N-acetyltransferase [uncultured Massilia sp.]|uniref:GNAT family N-acetyltransferase n=1 Tax=uncultured Massilia sp. TaxID=169973 RepID=UPI0025D9EBB4|nr:GNAT family N-acetyltransferase [uncultured Massilia sp.]
MEVAATARLRLRTATPDDAPFFLALVNDPGFVEHIGDRGIRTLDDARRALAEGPVAMQRARGHSGYIVELRACGTPIGTCGLIKRDTLEDVDLGYAFLEAHRGHGYAWEAANAALALAPALGLRRVVAITTPGNAASNGLLRKLGMRLEGVVRLTPEDTGTHLYSIDIGGA